MSENAAIAQQNTNDAAASYGADSIKVLRGLDAVRKRPVCILAIPMMAPAFTIWCMKLSITRLMNRLRDIVMKFDLINKDGSVTVRDNGRGIPVAIHPEEGSPPLKLS